MSKRTLILLSVLAVILCGVAVHATILIGGGRWRPSPLCRELPTAGACIDCYQHAIDVALEYGEISAQQAAALAATSVSWCTANRAVVAGP